MPHPHASRIHSFVFALGLLAPTFALAQTQAPPAKPAPQEDVVRVETEIVQTDVSVFDAQGRFVDGLKPEQFEVKVDGKPVPIVFFERVAGGAAGPAGAAPAGAAPAGAAPPAGRTRGRVVAFFMDDLHLSAESVERVRATVSRFIEQEMQPEDVVAVATPSGRIGFLQQFTGHKGVARAALARLAYRPYTVRDHENIPMTEYQALRIDQGDRDALDHFVTQIQLASNFRLPAGGGGIGPPPGGPTGQPLRGGMSTAGLNRAGAERLVKERASRIVGESSHVSLGTLRALESLMRTAARLPGRKLVFFFSDGFYINDRNTDFPDQLKQITDAALRAGVRIYTLDARGLVSTTDASSNRADPTGQLSRANVGELSASQDALTALAGDTGGRALLNSAAMDSALGRALDETANYYLLAWRPEADEQKGGRFRRVEVSVAGRPELKVRLPRGYFAGGAPRPAAEAKAAQPAAKPDAPATPAKKGADADLGEALRAGAAGGRVPTVVATSFVDVPGTGPVLTTGVQVSAAGLGYGPDGKQPAAVDLAGVVFNDQGKQAAGFKTRLNVAPPAEGATGGENVIYNHRAPLPPGLYQVRVATRDDRTGQVGAAVQWIEIPDLAKKQLALSSLHMGGRAVGGGKAGEEQVQFSVDHRFARSSKVDFIAFIYNAQRAGAGPPDLSAQVKVWRDGRAVVTGPARKLQTDAAADAARIPLNGGITLGQLPAGLYELEVIVTDNLAHASATQRAAFEVY